MPAKVRNTHEDAKFFSRKKNFLISLSVLPGGAWKPSACVGDTNGRNFRTKLKKVSNRWSHNRLIPYICRIK